MEKSKIRLAVARELKKYPHSSLRARLWEVKHFFAGVCAIMCYSNDFELAKEYADYHEYVRNLIETMLFNVTQNEFFRSQDKV